MKFFNLLFMFVVVNTFIISNSAAFIGSIKNNTNKTIGILEYSSGEKPKISNLKILYPNDQDYFGSLEKKGKYDVVLDPSGTLKQVYDTKSTKPLLSAEKEKLSLRKFEINTKNPNVNVSIKYDSKRGFLLVPEAGKNNVSIQEIAVSSIPLRTSEIELDYQNIGILFD